MQKIIRLLPVLLLFTIQLNAQNRLLDQPMIISNCSVNIKVNCIHATTDIELEFYNDRDVEIEGLLRFNLLPHQAITGFELDLNGQYRKGSIEERWKARNAYNTIVGKRVDPALVQMISVGQYTLNIYPIAAKSSRKVKIQIEEVLSLKDEYHQYVLDMFKSLTVRQIGIHVEATGNPYGPVSPTGLISRTTFNKVNSTYSLNDQYNQPVSGSTIAFKIPAPGQKEVSYRDMSTGAFMAKIQDTIPETVARPLKKIRVYWDRSASMLEANTEAFLKFLNTQVQRYNAEAVQIIPFNHKPGEAKTFTGNTLAPWYWRNFIKKTALYGGTNFGALNFNTSDDIIFVFTDGKHTWGSRSSGSPQTPVMYITVPFNDPMYNSKYYANDYYTYNYYYNGYNYNYNYNYPSTIRLNTADTTYNYPQMSQRRVELISASDENGNPLKLPEMEKVGSLRYIKGIIPANVRTITLNFGYGDKILFTRKVDINNYCGKDLKGRLNTLLQFELITGSSNNWYRSLAFGIENRIVCWQTAFIVLERIEDYVKFNITPPDEIMQECVDKGFVKTDYKQRYQYMQKIGAAEVLKQVATHYNQRLALAGNTKDQIKIADIAASFDRIEAEKQVADKGELAFSKDNMGDVSMGASLEEVVVTGYSSSKRKSLSGSVSYYSTYNIASSTTISEAIQGRVSGIQVINTPQSGDVSQVRIRGIRSMSEGTNPLLVLDGVPVAFDMINNIPTAQIQNITIIKDASAMAIYGARGSNGVIVVETKKGRYNGYNNYSDYANQKNRLEDGEDEDYITSIKATSAEEKYERYLELRKDNKTNMAFFIDMAMHFSDAGLSEHIDEMLMEAAEISNNDYASLLAIAYTYEYMRNFKKAAEIYTDLAKTYPYQLGLQHNIAWTYYESGQADSAVQVLYRAITSEDYYSNYEPNMKLKDMMLADMNMIISLHAGEVDTRYIPKEIIKPVSSELRVLLDANQDNLYTLAAQEGNKEKITYTKPTQGDNRLTLGGYSLSTAEFQAQEMGNKKIRLYIHHYDTWYTRQVPLMIRIRSIRNFGSADQRIETEVISLKNQFGEIEIADYRHRSIE